MNKRITKKEIKEYLCGETDLEKVWHEIKLFNLNNKYLSTNRAKKLWDHFSFVLRESFFYGQKINWEEIY